VNATERKWAHADAPTLLEKAGKTAKSCVSFDRPAYRGRLTMDDTLSLAELDDRIAILRDNLRQLVEQAAGSSGAQDEERTAERIAQQTEQLNKLIAERDSRSKK
jgi:uncharacterized small protein (DUF1192 family)